MGVAVPHGEAHEALLLGLNSEGWVYVGLTIFLILLVFVFRVPKLIAQALDQRIADTRRTLEEAKAIRAEAEALLADAKAREHAAVDDAKAILAHAEVEARQLVEKAEADVAELIGRRERMAEDRIAAAERQAVAEMREQAAGLATAAAERLIRDSYDKKTDKVLVDKTIAELGQR